MRPTKAAEIFAIRDIEISLCGRLCRAKAATFDLLLLCVPEQHLKRVRPARSTEFGGENGGGAFIVHLDAVDADMAGLTLSPRCKFPSSLLRARGRHARCSRQKPSSQSTRGPND